MIDVSHLNLRWLFIRAFQRGRERDDGCWGFRVFHGDVTGDAARSGRSANMGRKRWRRHQYILRRACWF
jgi:hypothetical protein